MKPALLRLNLDLPMEVIDGAVGEEILKGDSVSAQLAAGFLESRPRIAFADQDTTWQTREPRLLAGNPAHLGSAAIFMILGQSTRENHGG
jgi:hypothetical protein